MAIPYRLSSLLLTVFLATSSLKTYAQAPPKREDVRLSGKLKAIRGDVLYVVGEAGDQWLVKAPMRREIQDNIVYENSAHPSWLRPGVFVQFSANLDKKGRAHEPIGELKVFTPNKDSKIGLIAETGGIAGNLFTDPTEKETKKKKKAALETQAYQVAGPVSGIKKGRLFVSASGTVVEAEVADDAKITLELNDYTWAQEGDDVVVEGWVTPPQKANVYANRVTISGANKLTLDPKADKKKKNAPAKGTEKGEIGTKKAGAEKTD